MLTISNVYGTLGNNLYQLLGIIYMSQKLDDHINIEKLKESELNKLLHLDKIQKFINDSRNIKTKKINHAFFKLYQVDNSFNPKKEYFNIGKILIKFLKDEIRINGDNDLLIHIRSVQNHGSYVQLPLSFYVKLINETHYDKYIIITEKNCKNPVIKELKNLIPDIIIRENDFSNFYELLSCKNMVYARSTFSVTSIFLSPYIKIYIL
jgi:hypothetical protein